MMTAQQERHWATVRVQNELKHTLAYCNISAEAVEKFLKERIAKLEEQIQSEKAEALKS